MQCFDLQLPIEMWKFITRYKLYRFLKFESERDLLDVVSINLYKSQGNNYTQIIFNIYKYS